MLSITDVMLAMMSYARSSLTVLTKMCSGPGAVSTAILFTALFTSSLLMVLSKQSSSTVLLDQLQLFGKDMYLVQTHLVDKKLTYSFATLIIKLILCQLI